MISGPTSLSLSRVGSLDLLEAEAQERSCGSVYPWPVLRGFWLLGVMGNVLSPQLEGHLALRVYL